MYPFTLEPHVITLESSRRTTLAAHAARHAAVLRQREDEKERRKREALRRVAPGFEPTEGPLVPTKVSVPMLGGSGSGSVSSQNTGGNGAMVLGLGPGGPKKRDIMDDLVDHLALLDSRSGSGPGSAALTPPTMLSPARSPPPPPPPPPPPTFR